MDNEKIKILNMLEEGKIDVDEALKLIDAIDNKDTIKDIPKDDTTTEDSSHPDLFKSISNIGQEIGSMVSNIVDNAVSFGKDISSDDYMLIKQITYNIEDLNSPNLLFKTKNSPINISSTDGNKIIIDIKGKNSKEYTKNIEDIFNFSIEDNTISFIPKTINDISIGLDIKLPNILYNNIDINNSNGRISIKGIHANNLIANTSNGRINLKDLIFKEINITTTNGRINTYNIDSNILNLNTTNGSINNEYLNASEIILKSNNGSITSSLKDLNKDINLNLTTNLGSLKVDIPDLIYKKYNRDNFTNKKIIAYTNKDNTDIDYYANTLNGSITIR